MQAMGGKFTCLRVTCQRATSREACGSEKLLAGARGSRQRNLLAVAGEADSGLGSNILLEPAGADDVNKRPYKRPSILIMFYL